MQHAQDALQLCPRPTRASRRSAVAPRRRSALPMAGRKSVPRCRPALRPSLGVWQLPRGQDPPRSHHRPTQCHPRRHRQAQPPRMAQQRPCWFAEIAAPHSCESTAHARRIEWRCRQPACTGVRRKVTFRCFDSALVWNASWSARPACFPVEGGAAKESRHSGAGATAPPPPPLRRACY